MYSFRIKNFKSFKDSGEIRIKPITILVGKNSCGKSSLLRFLALLSQTMNLNSDTPPLSFSGEYTDYGNFEDVVFGKNGNEISFSLSYKIDITSNIKVLSDENGVQIYFERNGTDKLIKIVTISTVLRRFEKSMKVTEVSVSVSDKLLSRLCWDDSHSEYHLELKSFFDGEKVIPVSEQIVFRRNEVSFDKFFPFYKSEIIDNIIRTKGLSIDPDRRRDINIYHLLKKRGIEDTPELTDEEIEIARTVEIFDYSAALMSRIYDIFRGESKTRISYIGPFRQNPGRIYRNSEAVQFHVGAKGENVGDILAGAYQRKDSNPLFENISKWLEKYFGYSLTIHDLGNDYFQLMLQDSFGKQHNIIDVGFGISQVLPIILESCITATQGSKRKNNRAVNNSIMLIEQPELHLHPAAQASLAELFAMCVTSNKNSRMIIETHSEHLISKLQVLIADENNPLTNEMVQILYVDKAEDGASFIQEMQIKENGKFVNKWPTGFFDQGYSLSYELMKKSASRDKGKSLK